MRDADRGFSLLVVTVIVLAISLLLCASIASRVAKDRENLQRHHHFKRSINALDTQMAIEVAQIATEKKPRSARTYSTGSRQIILTTTAESAFSSSDYSQVFRIKGQVYSRPNALPDMTQSVALGAFQLINAVPNQAITHMDNAAIGDAYFNPGFAEYELTALLGKFSAASFSTCNMLNTAAKGIVVIAGDCQLHDMDLGQKKRPVVLVIIDGSGDFVAKSTLRGLLLHICTSTEKHHLTFSADASIVGAVVSSCATPVDIASVKKDIAILNTLIGHIDNKHMEIIAGSWAFD